MYNIFIVLSLLINVVLFFSILLITRKLKKQDEIFKILNKKVHNDFENDVKFLENSISNNFSFFENNILNSLKNKNSQGLLRDDDVEKIVSVIVSNIQKDLSKEYIELISFYIKDVNYYITKRVNDKITPYIVALNVNRLYK